MSFGTRRRADKINSRIEDQDVFTTVVTASEIKPRQAELVIVSLGESADYIGIARAGRLVATDQKTVEVSTLTPLDSLGNDQIIADLPSRFRHHARFPPDGTRRLSVKLWREILAAIVRARPALRAVLPKMRKLIAESLVGPGRREGGLEVFERDAVASALETWAGRTYRKRLLRSAAAPDVSASAPFLTRL